MMDKNLFIIDDQWMMTNDLNHLRSDDLDIHRCISFCG
jgi:hypothetical protein